MSKKQKLTEEFINQAIQNVLKEVQEDFEILKQKEEWVIGVDEAGRGPVLGPMIYAACYWPKKYDALIRTNCPFNDSKQLKEVERDLLFKLLQGLRNKVLQFETKILSAEFLSVNQQAYIPNNLNDLSHNSALQLIKNALDENYKITSCYFDTVGPKFTYQKWLVNNINNSDIEVVVEEKADSKYLPVSAASICAKVTRDEFIPKIKERLNYEGDIGCGYPSDNKTKQFLSDVRVNVFGFNNDIRFSWQTTKTELEKNGLEVEYFEESNYNPLQKVFNTGKAQRYRQQFYGNIII